MDEKLEILQRYLPRAALKPLTLEALEAMPAALRRDNLIPMNSFPFRVGRESRVRQIDGRLERIERSKKDDSEPNNDIYLVDGGRLLNISREHFQIEKKGEDYLLVDRGSACGTKIGEQGVGGNDMGGMSPLKDGDIVAVGAKSTPYVYQFIDLSGFELVRRP